MRPKSLAMTLALIVLPVLSHAQSRQYCMKLNSPTVTNQYAVALNKTGLEGNANYTLEAWVNPDSYTNFPTIISNSFAHSFWLGLNTAGKVRFYPVDSGHGFFEGSIIIPTGHWTHIAAVHSGSNSYIYVNGVLDGQSTTISGVAPSDTAALCVGADRGDASTNFYWRGRLDEVRIWSKARTAAEIKALLSIPAGDPGYYPSPTYHQLVANWTFENSAVNIAFDFAHETGDDNPLAYIHGDYYSLLENNGAPVAVNTAYGLDGATDYVDTGMGDGFNAGVSIEAWLRTPGGTGFQAIVGRNFLSSFWLGLTPDLHVRFYPTGGVGNYVDSDATIPANLWCQIAATYNNGQIALYLNGAIIPFHGPTITGLVGENGTTAYIGGDHGSTLYAFKGDLDEVRITRGRLSAQTIAMDRFLSWEPFTPIFGRVDADGVGRISEHFSAVAAEPGVHGTQLARVRSGAPLADSYEMPAIASQNIYSFATWEGTGPQTEPPLFVGSTSLLTVPYNVAVNNPTVFVDATISDLNRCRMTLLSPNLTSVALLDAGNAYGRDLLTVIRDGSGASFATGHAPFLDGVSPDHALAAFNGQGSLGDWQLSIQMGLGATGDLVSWGIHFQNTPAAVDGRASDRVALAIRGANPARGSAAFAFTLPAESVVDLALFDLQGRRVAKLYNGRSPGGDTVLNWNATQVAPGTYFARLRVNGEAKAETKLTLVR
jgi:hypothetical protein